MKELLQTISREISGTARFVFPSEIAAAFWLEKMVREGPVTCVRRDRFISWDTFKEQAFDLTSDRKPANRISRGLFIEDLLHRNSSGPNRFPQIIPEDFCGESTSFRQVFETMIPRLPAFFDVLKEGGERTAEANREFHAYSGDLGTLLELYTAFLEKYGLYEPSWTKPAREHLRETSQPYLIVLPELLEDYQEFAQVLAGSQNFSIYRLPDTGSAQPCRVWRNARVEGEVLLTEVTALLEQGTPPDSIAVTVCGLSAWRGWLEREAALRGIPLWFRQGKPVAEYAAGALFRKLVDLGSSGFVLEDFAALVRNRVYPWKEREALEKLVKFGIENHCLANLQKTRHGMMWEQALERRGAGRLKALFERLQRGIRAIASAPDFDQLRRRLHTFAGSFFDSDGWNPEQERVFQAGLDLLKDLSLQQQLLSALELKDPVGFWLRILDTKQYVPKQTARGIPVYDYRVAAGILPEYHFIVNMTDKDTAAVSDPFPFLSDDRRRFVDAEEKDLTDSFILAYLQSGNNVRPGYSSEGFAAAQLPAPLLMEQDLLTPGDESLLDRLDPLRLEKAYWQKKGLLPALYAVQQTGVESAGSTAWVPAGTDFTNSVSDDNALRSLAVIRGGDPLVLSASSISRLLTCRFTYLLNDLFWIQEDEYAVDQDLYQLKGIFFHHVLELIMEPGFWKDGPPWKNGQEYWEGFLQQRIGDAAASREERDTIPSWFLWQQIKNEAKEKLTAFPAAFEKHFSGALPVKAEGTLHADFNEDVKLKGRTDLELSLAGETWVVDHKSNLKISRQRLNLTESSDPEVQMPFYLLLRGLSGRSEGYAAYFNIAECTFKIVNAPEDSSARPIVSSEQMEASIAILRQWIRDEAEAVSRGDFRTPEGGCDPCRFRRICREKYFVKVES